MPLTHVVYVTYLSTAQHGSTKRVLPDLREKLAPLLCAGYMVIPPTMLINLWLVPLRFRVLFLNVVLGVGYGGYMNWQINRRGDES